MDVVVSYTQNTCIKKCFLSVPDSYTRSVCESLLPELSHDLIGKAQVKVYTKLLWISFDPLWAGWSWTLAKRNLTQARELDWEGPDWHLVVEISDCRQRLLVLSMFFTSPQGPWCNTSIDSDGERLHERVRNYYIYCNNTFCHLACRWYLKEFTQCVNRLLNYYKQVSTVSN